MKQKCLNCGRKKPMFGYLIECVNCKSLYCKQCAEKFAGVIMQNQRNVALCPKCGGMWMQIEDIKG